MQTVACPSCGAPVSFRSTASVMAVCEFCHSTLLKDADSVKDIGKMSQVLEDFSPIQITTAGTFDGRAFSVVGRIQLRYEDGCWNEWYVLFNDGRDGWLSDASGQYVLTQQQPTPPNLPEFSALASGKRCKFGGVEFTASDVRSAKCIAGEGELPVKVGAGWEAKVADFRSADRFLTLDYSDGATPQMYSGKSVTLTDMRCQLLRSDDMIAGKAGKFRGKTTALSCPSCGGAIKYQTGMATHVVCPSCRSEIDCSADTALVLRKQQETERVKTTLALGDAATIDGVRYELIGLMKCREIEESSVWTEYLLFNAKRGFLWLVESSEGWDRVEVLNVWPQGLAGLAGSQANFRGKNYHRLYDYGAEVVYAAGAFNWRVSVGDQTRIADFGLGGEKLTAESTPAEINWSFSKRVEAKTVMTWFGRNAASAPATPAGYDARDWAFNLKAAAVYSLLIFFVNLPLVIRNEDEDGFSMMFVAMFLLWLPLFKSSSTSDD